MKIELVPDFGSLAAVKGYFVDVGVSGIIFLCSFLVLSLLFFNPLKKILKSRKKMLIELDQETRRLKNEASDKEEEYAWRLQGAAQLAQEKRAVSRIISQKRAEMVLATVKSEAGRDLKNIIESTEQNLAAVSKFMDSKIGEFANDIKTKILSD